MSDTPRRATLSGNAPMDGEHVPAPDMSTDANGMHPDYWVLSQEERAKGFVRPVRRTYVHTVCGVATTMNQAIAETYAREPRFYGATYCVACRGHYPVGKDGQFVWDGTNEKVGT